MAAKKRLYIPVKVANPGKLLFKIKTHGSSEIGAHYRPLLSEQNSFELEDIGAYTLTIQLSSRTRDFDQVQFFFKSPFFTSENGFKKCNVFITPRENSKVWTLKKAHIETAKWLFNAGLSSLPSSLCKKPFINLLIPRPNSKKLQSVRAPVLNTGSIYNNAQVCLVYVPHHKTQKDALYGALVLYEELIELSRNYELKVKKLVI